ncbi:dihydrodipicolinate synthase family protein [Burkholderia sp. Ac-20344]|uniref:dihydrodipicolinate synthase family protein n=1 Tax=Burkholderia sp. Ac-20344 TaxID=2703890 RepID=UPI00197C37D7|nr:dihydrodipicolinate synthase family protein [Burkholderia sp. Ac-20344]MBN3830347.1 dihydrodipicolinate synthase family protein [Burkholderia sp. Ac-20344]
MIPSTPYPFHGVYAATLCPLDVHGRTLDEAALARHLAEVASVNGIVGLLVNGHAGENHALSRDEKRRVVEIAHAVCGDRSIIVAGVNAEDSYEAQLHADDAKRAGADALLLFPPFSWALSTDRDIVLAHHRIANATARLPMMLYQAGINTGGMAYPPDTLATLAALPDVIAVKEGSWETSAYEANRRLVQAVAPHVAVMASGDEHLFTCFALGTEGSLVSLAAVVPEHVVALYRAVADGRLADARKLHAMLYPLARAIYGTAPGSRATARLKACLHLTGKFPYPTARPPITPLSADEIARLEAALALALEHDRSAI